MPPQQKAAFFSFCALAARRAVVGAGRWVECFSRHSARIQSPLRRVLCVWFCCIVAARAGCSNRYKTRADTTTERTGTRTPGGTPHDYFAAKRRTETPREARRFFKPSGEGVRRSRWKTRGVERSDAPLRHSIACLEKKRKYRETFRVSRDIYTMTARGSAAQYLAPLLLPHFKRTNPRAVIRTEDFFA